MRNAEERGRGVTISERLKENTGINYINAYPLCYAPEKKKKKRIMEKK